MKILVMIATGFVLGLGIVGICRADDDDSRSLDLAKAARTPLATAVANAELATGGKAIEADIDDEGPAAGWEVKVATAAGIKTVLVDMGTGQVSRTMASEDDEWEFWK